MPPSIKPIGPASLESRPASAPDDAVAHWDLPPVDWTAYLACRESSHAWTSLATVESEVMQREVVVCEGCGGRMNFEWRK